MCLLGCVSFLCFCQVHWRWRCKRFGSKWLRARVASCLFLKVAADAFLGARWSPRAELRSRRASMKACGLY